MTTTVRLAPGARAICTAESHASVYDDVIVPTLAETSGDFIGPLNPHVGRLRSIAYIKRHKRGPRLYVGGKRIHHGPAFGLAAVLCWRFRWRTLAAALGAYAATNWRDFPFTDECNH